MFFTLLRPYYLSFLNSLTRGRDVVQVKRTYALFSIVALIIMFCIFLGIRMVLGSLQDSPLMLTIIPKKLLELLFYAFFFLLLISNTVAAVGNIFTADNMNLYMTIPISPIRLYLSKLCEMLFETSLMFFIFIVPVAVAYYSVLDTSILFMPAMIVCSIPFLLIPAGLAVPVAAAFVKFASIFWRRGLLLFLALLALGVFAFSEFMQILSQLELRSGGRNAFIQLIGFFDNPNPVWSPSRWFVDLLMPFIGITNEMYAYHLTLLIATAVGALSIGYLTFDYSLLSVRSASVNNESANEHDESKLLYKPKFDIVRQIIEFACTVIPFREQTRAIILKDSTSLVRDRAQALQLLLYLGIAVSYLVLFRFMSSALHLSSTAGLAWLSFLATINILFAGFIITALMTRLVYPSVSLEGRSFWILQTAPISMRKLVSAKFFCWLPLTILVTMSLLGTGAYVIGIRNSAFLLTLLIGLFISIGFTGMAIGLGAVFAIFDWESPTKISTGFGTLILLIVSLLFIVALTFLSAGVMWLDIIPELRVKFGIRLSYFLMVISLFTIMTVNIFVAKISCERGVRALEGLRNQ